jgi:hypothetical protein
MFNILKTDDLREFEYRLKIIEDRQNDFLKHATDILKLVTETNKKSWLMQVNKELLSVAKDRETMKDLKEVRVCIEGDLTLTEK